MAKNVIFSWFSYCMVSFIGSWHIWNILVDNIRIICHIRFMGLSFCGVSYHFFGSFAFYYLI